MFEDWIAHGLCWNMWKAFFGALILVVVSNAQQGSDLGVFVDEKKVVWCYYNLASWTQNRTGNGKCEIEDIDSSLCTHLVYAFIGIDDKGELISINHKYDLHGDEHRDHLARFNRLKQKNKNLKTILAIGGPDDLSKKYSLMANSPELRNTFVNHTTEFMLVHGFDGLDIDWIYPARRDSLYGATDVPDFTILLSELRQAFDKQWSGLILSAGVGALRVVASSAYDIPEITKHLDYIGLYTMDMNYPWRSTTGHNAPLHRGLGDDNIPREDAYSVDVAVEYWLAQGAPPGKLLLGLPFYGHSFKLANPEDNGVRAANVDLGIAGPYTRDPGTLGFNEICLHATWDVYFDQKARVPYKTLGVDWISYDDKLSLNEKSRYSLDKNLGGVMAFTIDLDDCQGGCNDGKFPLLNAVNRALNYYAYDIVS